MTSCFDLEYVWDIMGKNVLGGWLLRFRLMVLHEKILWSRFMACDPVRLSSRLMLQLISVAFVNKGTQRTVIPR